MKTHLLRIHYCLTITACILLAGCQPSKQTEHEAMANAAPGNEVAHDADRMPDFVLQTLAGETFDSSDHGGRVLLVNFWATWCAPCRLEIPDLIELQNELGSDDFAVIGISVDHDDASLVQDFAEAMEINYPVMIDNGKVGEAFGGVYALPTTFIVDKGGEITHRTIGLFPIASVKEELVSMIAAE